MPEANVSGPHLEEVSSQSAWTTKRRPMLRTGRYAKSSWSPGSSAAGRPSGGYGQIGVSESIQRVDGCAWIENEIRARTRTHNLIL